MKEVPSIGGARGIFENFVPGSFLFFNIIGIIYVLPTIEEDFKKSIFSVGSQAIPSLAVIVCFGYLLGVLLRLLKARAPDRLSGRFLWLLSKFMHKENRAFLEDFPYFTYIEKVAWNRLPEEAYHFYCDFWGQKAISGNREFFNYCKNINNSIDEKSAIEVNAAEALTRYVTSMFYALLISFILTFITAIVTTSIGFLVLACAYLLAVIIILRNLRFLRVKEVETVFAATMRNYYSEKWPKIMEEVNSLKI